MDKIPNTILGRCKEQTKLLCLALAFLEQPYIMLWTLHLCWIVCALMTQ